MSTTGQKSLLRGFFPWVLSLFLLGMGMKLLMLRRCVNSLPYFDQWEAEGAAIYLPWLQHKLTLADLFRPQNEHRIFFTHVLDLALLWLNKQWDCQLQMVVNALIHSATLAGFAWFMSALLDRRHWPFLWLPLAVAVTSPFGWENALWGFQSQFYFLILFSLLAIPLLGCKPFSVPWLLGLLAGICSLFTMASGLLAFVAAGMVALFELLRCRPAWRRHLPTLLMCVALAFVGLLLLGRTGDDTAAARSLRDFFTALGSNLSWPMGTWPWLAPFNLLPLLLLAWTYFRSPQTNQPAERVVLGLGFWAVLQSLATAAVRGAGGAPPAWRYMDILGFLFLANVLSAAMLCFKYHGFIRFPVVSCAALLVWLIPCAIGLWSLNARAWNIVIPKWATFQFTRVELTRQFLATDNDMVFANRDPRDLPWNFVPGLVSLLRMKEIRAILPVCVRDPLKLTPANATASAFIPAGVPFNRPDLPTESCLGSYTANGAAATGVFESAPLSSSLPYLQIQVTGNLGTPDLSLHLVSLSSGKITRVKPAREPGGQWLDVDAKAPPGQFKLVARDDSSRGWFAFQEPREMGRLSFWAETIVAAAKYFFAAGCLAFAAAIGLYCLPRSPNAVYVLSPSNNS